MFKYFKLWNLLDWANAMRNTQLKNLVQLLESYDWKEELEKEDAEPTCVSASITYRGQHIIRFKRVHASHRVYK